MPHIVLEYSENLALSADKLLQAAYQAVLDSQLFSYDSVKARHIAYSHYILPEGDILPEGAAHFAHITISILSGRTLQERQSVSDAVFAAVKATGVAIDKLSINLHEMEKETYRK